VVLAEATSGREVWHRPLEGITALGFSPCGRLVVAGTGDGKLHLLDGATGKERLAWTASPGAERVQFRFSPDGRRLATVGYPSDSCSVLVWDVSDVTAPPVPAPRGPKAREVEGWLRALGGEDPGAAGKAGWNLARAPDVALPELRERLQPVALDRERIARLTAALEDEDFARREHAAKDLVALGPRARPALEMALRGKPSAEQKRRLEQVLADLPLEDAHTRLGWRGVLLLEQIGTGPARELLSELAGRDPDSELSQEARDALRRLELRQPRRQ
jgi:hypothetical protein